MGILNDQTHSFELATFKPVGYSLTLLFFPTERDHIDTESNAPMKRNLEDLVQPFAALKFLGRWELAFHKNSPTIFRIAPLPSRTIAVRCSTSIARRRISGTSEDCLPHLISWSTFNEQPIELAEMFGLELLESGVSATQIADYHRLWKQLFAYIASERATRPKELNEIPCCESVQFLQFCCRDGFLVSAFLEKHAPTREFTCHFIFAAGGDLANGLPWHPKPPGEEVLTWIKSFIAEKLLHRGSQGFAHSWDKNLAGAPGNGKPQLRSLVLQAIDPAAAAYSGLDALHEYFAYIHVFNDRNTTSLFDKLCPYAIVQNGVTMIPIELTSLMPPKRIPPWLRDSPAGLKPGPAVTHLKKYSPSFNIALNVYYRTLVATKQTNHYRAVLHLISGIESLAGPALEWAHAAIMASAGETKGATIMKSINVIAPAIAAITASEHMLETDPSNKRSAIPNKINRNIIRSFIEQKTSLCKIHRKILCDLHDARDERNTLAHSGHNSMSTHHATCLLEAYRTVLALRVFLMDFAEQVGIEPNLSDTHFALTLFEFSLAVRHKTCNVSVASSPKDLIEHHARRAWYSLRNLSHNDSAKEIREFLRPPKTHVPPAELSLALTQGSYN